MLFNTLAAVRKEYPEGSVENDAVGRARRLSWLGQRLCALHGVHVRSVGPLPSGRCIVVANHLSYVDPVAICSLIECSAIAKREVAGWPVIGDTLRTLGVLMVERESASSGAVVLRQAMRRLNAGVPVLAFPEGTTSEGDDVLPLRRGLFGVAQLLGVRIVPLGVRYQRRDLAWVGGAPFLPHYARTVSFASTTVELRFGEPIEPHCEPNPRALADFTRQRLRALLEA